MNNLFWRKMELDNTQSIYSLEIFKKKYITTIYINSKSEIYFIGGLIKKKNDITIKNGIIKRKRKLHI